MIEVALHEFSHVAARQSSAPSIVAVQTQKSASKRRRGLDPMPLPDQFAMFLIAGIRSGQGRSANMTIRALSFAADTTESVAGGHGIDTAIDGVHRAAAGFRYAAAG